VIQRLTGSGVLKAQADLIWLPVRDRTQRNRHGAWGICVLNEFKPWYNQHPNQTGTL